jgi:hypothetical protein
MKYTSILAGVLGLMALAACTNNDEIKIEQPQLARTLTVTWGGSADTRLGLMFTDVNAPIKSYWEKNDEIGVSIDAGKDVITYKTTDETSSVKTSATFTLVGDVGPVADEEYFVVYPKSYATEGLDFSQQSGLSKDLYNYAYAMAWPVTFTENESNLNVTLTPFSTFLVIPEGTEFPELGDFLTESECADVYFELSGSDLIKKIQWEEAITKGVAHYSPYISGDITITKAASATKNFIEKNEEGKFVAAHDIFIAVPIASDPVTNASLYVRLPDTDSRSNWYVEYEIWTTTAGGGKSATIESGKFYNLDGHLLCNGGGEM